MHNFFLIYHFRFVKTLFNQFLPEIIIMLHGYKLHSLYTTNTHYQKHSKINKKHKYNLERTRGTRITSSISPNWLIRTARACFVFPIRPRMNTCSLKRSLWTHILYAWYVSSGVNAQTILQHHLNCSFINCSNLLKRVMLTTTKKRKQHLWIIVCIKLDLTKKQGMHDMRRMAHLLMH